jgi:hypothetical protein
MKIMKNITLLRALFALMALGAGTPALGMYKLVAKKFSRLKVTRPQVCSYCDSLSEPKIKCQNFFAKIDSARGIQPHGLEGLSRMEAARAILEKIQFLVEQESKHYNISFKMIDPSDPSDDPYFECAQKVVSRINGLHVYQPGEYTFSKAVLFLLSSHNQPAYHAGMWLHHKIPCISIPFDRASGLTTANSIAHELAHYLNGDTPQVIPHQSRLQEAHADRTGHFIIGSGYGTILHLDSQPNYHLSYEGLFLTDPSTQDIFKLMHPTDTERILSAHYDHTSKAMDYIREEWKRRGFEPEVTFQHEDQKVLASRANRVGLAAKERLARSKTTQIASEKKSL